MNQTAIITGASSGIGYEFAKILKEKGYKIILIARSEDKLQALQKELGEAKIIVKDLSVPNAASSIFNELKDETIDVLINNAGIGDYGKFNNADWTKLNQMIQLNMTALTELMHLFLPSMLERKSGRILNVASTASFQPGPLMATYYATKAYVLHLSEAISSELKGTGVTVTTLCPGPTQSSFQEMAGMGDSSLVKGKKLPTSKEVAVCGYKAMIKGKKVAVHGFINFIMASSYRYMPRGLLTSAVGKFQESRN